MHPNERETVTGIDFVNPRNAAHIHQMFHVPAYDKIHPMPNRSRHMERIIASQIMETA